MFLYFTFIPEKKMGKVYILKCDYYLYSFFEKEKKTYKTKKWYVCISFKIRKNTPN